MADKNKPPGIFTKALEANAYWIEYCAFCFDHIGKPNDKLCREYALTRQELMAGNKTLQLRRNDFCWAIVSAQAVSSGPTLFFLTSPRLAVNTLSPELVLTALWMAGISTAISSPTVTRFFLDELSSNPADSRAVIFTAARDKWMSTRQEKMRQGQHRGQHQIASAPA